MQQLGVLDYWTSAGQRPPALRIRTPRLELLGFAGNRNPRSGPDSAPRPSARSCRCALNSSTALNRTTNGTAQCRLGVKGKFNPWPSTADGVALVAPGPGSQPSQLFTQRRENCFLLLPQLCFEFYLKKERAMF